MNQVDGDYTKHIYIGSQRTVSKLGDLDSYGQDPRRIAYAGSVSIDFTSKYKEAQETVKDRYTAFEVECKGSDNDDYVNGGGFCCDDAPGLRAGAIGNGNDNPEIYQYYYHSDHLGSTSLITNLDGEVVQHVEYVPFGEVFIEERNNRWNTPYLFNAKELDEETGLYYYGARYYDSRTSIWLGVDPMWEKYPGISSYAYCMNNSIRYTDPDGREVWIHYMENDELGKILYTANMNYEGNNTFVSASVTALNAAYNNGGSEVIDNLISSSDSFNILDQTPTDSKGNTIDALKFVESEYGGGDIYAGMLTNSSYSNYSKVEGVSHELFHGFQYEQGQGGASIFNEVEAMTYSSVIAANWSTSTDYIGVLSSNGLGNGTENGNTYQQAFKSLVNNGYSKTSFVDAVKSFKSGSNTNVSGGYNNYPLMRYTNQKSLLPKYLPKLK
jgi:RHS repeat-associated protein